MSSCQNREVISIWKVLSTKVFGIGSKPFHNYFAYANVHVSVILWSLKLLSLAVVKGGLAAPRGRYHGGRPTPDWGFRQIWSGATFLQSYKNTPKHLNIFTSSYKSTLSSLKKRVKSSHILTSFYESKMKSLQDRASYLHISENRVISREHFSFSSFFTVFQSSWRRRRQRVLYSGIFPI